MQFSAAAKTGHLRTQKASKLMLAGALLQLTLLHRPFTAGGEGACSPP